MAKKPPPLYIPVIGVLVGGRLNGWQYRFQSLHVHGDSFRIVARISAPKWPFPCDMTIAQGDHYRAMTVLKSTVYVKRLGFLALDQEVRAAFQAARRELPQGADRPQWLLDLQQDTSKWRMHSGPRIEDQRPDAT